MGWGNNNNISVGNLNDSTDDPSQARVDILNAFYELQAVITGRNTSNGVCPLDADSLVPAANLPNTITSSATNNLFLAPATGRVAVQDIVNLPQKTVSQLNALSSPVTGDIANCSNGDTGDACLAYYDGTTWLRIALGATISAT
jgi:hypothetical protein